MLEHLKESPIVAVLRAPTAEAAVGAVDALVAGGVTAIEITYSTPEVAAAMLATVRVTMLGALTPTEVMVPAPRRARREGIPRLARGPAYLRSLRGPFPDVPHHGGNQ